MRYFISGFIVINIVIDGATIVNGKPHDLTAVYIYMISLYLYEFLMPKVNNLLSFFL